MKKIILILSCLSISLYAFADSCNAPKDQSKDDNATVQAEGTQDDATVQAEGTQEEEVTPNQE